MNWLTTRARSLVRLLTRRGRFDTEMHDEMRFHIDMETERLIRVHGLSPDEARRRAHVAFGGVEKFRQEGRATHPLHWVDVLSSDAKLGVRMLAKYRGLTLAGGFAMAVAIAIGAATFEILNEMLTPALPFDPAGRVVSLQVPSADARLERKVLHAFVDLREQLVSIEQVSAWRTVQRNIVTVASPPEPIRIAEMSASGFVIARTPPLLGRALVADDEREGAPAVMVVGYEVWQSRFTANPRIVGRTVNVGGVPHTVVGVMPEGFRFPHSHQYWIPLRANPLEFPQGTGPSLYMFGRLAPGVSLEQAQAELETVGQHLGRVHERSQVWLEPRVLPYTREHVDLNNPTIVWVVRLAQLLVGMLAFVVAVNIAILLYARTVSRIGEMAVRTALGASRRRILAQLFIEALALAVFGAVVGLGLAAAALNGVQAIAHANGGVPFWIEFELSTATVVYALALAVGAAAIMGVLPGLKATSRGVIKTMHEMNGRSGTRLGPVWTTLVVAQVAVAVAVLPMAALLSWQIIRMEIAGPGFAADRFVVGSIFLAEEAADVDRDVLRARQLALMSRLGTEPGVEAVTFSSAVPGFAGGRRFEFEEHVAVKDGVDLQASTLDVDTNLFAIYDAHIIAGRSLASSDAAEGGAVIVNETFARVYLAGRSPLGVRFRYEPVRIAYVQRRDPAGGATRLTQEPWYEIVGVVRDFPSFPPNLSVDGEPMIYHGAAAGEIHPVVLSVRYAGAIPPDAADRFRLLGAALDPAMQLRRVVRLSDYYGDVRSFWRYLAWGIGLVTASVLLLSAAGIYAMMAFTVAQRTREIGIRAALGAHPRRILVGVFGRAAWQLGLGLLIGAVLSGAVGATSSLGIANTIALVGAVAALMLIVGVLATMGPARRSLRIQASEALRADS